MSTLRFTVFGTPGPQGSKRHVGNGRMIESSKLVKPWRSDVKDAAETAIRDAEQGTYPMRGPLCVIIAFTLKKPMSAPKRTRTWPSKKPDLDKLIRSTFDAIGSAGVWVDDAQVIDVRSMKSYPCEGPWSLAAPGAVVHVFPTDGSPDGPGGTGVTPSGATRAKESALDSREGADRTAQADGVLPAEGGAL